MVFVRNALSALVAMTLTPWIAGVGFKNVFIMCAVLAFVFAALTIPMMIWGRRLRVWTGPRFEYMKARQFGSRG